METLKKYRIKYNLSYKNMGDLLGISKTFYWQIENNKRRLSYERAIQIAKIFKVSPDEIFYEEIKKQGLKS
ncbi:MAG: helix-turn-helix transcriptional regulator [Firmicutes bacterium]|nr:helix-turn-helix transcriptional regulator [Bacillota bacterium]